MTLVIQGGTVVDPSQDIEEKIDLLIEDGRIAGLGRIPPARSRDVIDASGWVAAPGFIDMHVHLREPGQEEKETIATGCRAAAAGGFTSIMCMPNTDPVNDSPEITRFILQQARRERGVNVFPCGAVTRGQKGEQLTDMEALVEAGAVAVSDDGHPVWNDQLMRKALLRVGNLDVVVVDHCENRELAAGGCINEGAVSRRLGLPGLSRAAEELDVARDVVLSRLTGGRVHIAHLSTRESLQWVRDAKARGVPVTCEVTPHHFLLTEEAVGQGDANFKMNPPLREQADVDALLEGLADGAVDCIATDHAPHTAADKAPPFERAANGIIGMETAVPLAWEFLVRRGIVSIRRLVELFSVNPSRILKLGRGTLAEGSPADVTLIDPKRRVRIDSSRFESKSRNCPFDGWELRGAPMMTIVDGRVVYRRERNQSFER